MVHINFFFFLCVWLWISIQGFTCKASTQLLSFIPGQLNFWMYVMVDFSLLHCCCCPVRGSHLLSCNGHTLGSVAHLAWSSYFGAGLYTFAMVLAWMLSVPLVVWLSYILSTMFFELITVVSATTWLRIEVNLGLNHSFMLARQATGSSPRLL